MFTVYPNLPQGNVKSVLLGEKYCDFLSGPLSRIGVKTLPVPRCQTLGGEEGHHADMLLFHLGKNRLIVHENMDCKAISLYSQYDAEILKSGSSLQRDYPYNIILNGLLIGSLFFHSLKFTDCSIKANLNPNICALVDVRQGYSKCAVAVVNERSAITSDRGMEKALLDSGIDALLIRPGFIHLDGNRYGFIGGCCGKISKDKLAFTGTLNFHPDKLKILNFLESKNIRPVFLTDGPLIDVGSILPLTEEDF